MVTDNLRGNMGCTPILSVNVSVKQIRCVDDKNGDIDGTCKRNFVTVRHKVPEMSIYISKNIIVLPYSH